MYVYGHVDSRCLHGIPIKLPPTRKLCQKHLFCNSLKSQVRRPPKWEGFVCMYVYVCIYVCVHTYCIHMHIVYLHIYIIQDGGNMFTGAGFCYAFLSSSCSELLSPPQASSPHVTTDPSPRMAAKALKLAWICCTFFSWSCTPPLSP